MQLPVLQPGRNVWRIERAGRATVLVDGAAFFTAVRQACLKAQRRILIVGWDIDSRTRLVGAEAHADGMPDTFADFLAQLVEQRPGLEVDMLLWDYSLLYAGEREMLPRLSLQWCSPPRMNLCLDNSVPFGSSQHQKIVVIDDAVAFSGGLDITIRRWDTTEHRLDDPRRVDPSGRPYRPFHDVQMMVDGEAAHALAELARTRWCRANGGVPVIEPVGDPWPDEIAPDFTDVEIGISRTQPSCDDTPIVHEVEDLFLDMIDRAERSIYIENQFATCINTANRLARQLRRRPELEVVIVSPRSHDSWFERRSMRNGRIRFWRRLRKAGRDRVRLLYPHVEGGGRVTDTMIHSKVMVIDDRILRIGSANLNNRSMGVDTECDLVIEAATDKQRKDICAVRDRLIAEHCGVAPARVTEELRRHGSIVRVADRVTANGHSLRPIRDGKLDRLFLSRLVEKVADPRRPVKLATVVGRVLSRALAPHNGVVALLGIVLLALSLTLAWKVSGLSEIATPDTVKSFFMARALEPWAPLLAVLAFLAGSAVAFPVTVLILVTAAVFGPLMGGAYSLLGVGASASLFYWLGARFGQAGLSRLFGKRWERISGHLRRRGVLAVVAVRVLPVAPFSVVNLAVGASSIRPIDFALGTLLGMAPGIVLMSVLGDRIVHTLIDPTVAQVGWLALGVGVWLGVSFGVQALISRLTGEAA